MVKGAIVTAFITLMWGIIRWQISGHPADAIGPFAVFGLCILLLVIYAFRESIAKVIKKIFNRE